MVTNKLQFSKNTETNNQYSAEKIKNVKPYSSITKFSRKTRLAIRLLFLTGSFFLCLNPKTTNAKENTPPNQTLKPKQHISITVPAPIVPPPPSNKRPFIRVKPDPPPPLRKPVKRPSIRVLPDPPPPLRKPAKRPPIRLVTDPPPPLHKPAKRPPKYTSTKFSFSIKAKSTPTTTPKSTYKHRTAFLHSAREETNGAKTRFDTKTPDFTEQDKRYSAFLDRFADEDLPKILDNLPFALGQNPEVVNILTQKLNCTPAFPEIDICEQGEGWAGKAYCNQQRYEVDDDFETYSTFKHTSIHELVHILLQSYPSDSIFHANLGEGLAEFITNQTATIAGINDFSNRKTYPEVYSFVQRLFQLNPLCLAIFFTNIEIPQVDFTQLPKINIDGSPKTYLDDVQLPTAGTRYLCHSLLSHLDPRYLALSTPTQELQPVFQNINGFLKSLFNTQFSTKEEKKKPMNQHYKSMTQSLNTILNKYRVKRRPDSLLSLYFQNIN